MLRATDHGPVGKGRVDEVARALAGLHKPTRCIKTRREASWSSDRSPPTARRPTLRVGARCRTCLYFIPRLRRTVRLVAILDRRAVLEAGVVDRVCQIEVRIPCLPGGLARRGEHPPFGKCGSTRSPREEVIIAAAPGAAQAIGRMLGKLAQSGAAPPRSPPLFRRA